MKGGRVERYIPDLAQELLMEDNGLETVRKAPPGAVFPSPYRPLQKARAERNRRRDGRV